jgi:hypothetical protein
MIPPPRGMHWLAGGAMPLSFQFTSRKNES